MVSTNCSVFYVALPLIGHTSSYLLDCFSNEHHDCILIKLCESDLNGSCIYWWPDIGHLNCYQVSTQRPAYGMLAPLLMRGGGSRYKYQGAVGSEGACVAMFLSFAVPSLFVDSINWPFSDQTQVTLQLGVGLHDLVFKIFRQSTLARVSKNFITWAQTCSRLPWQAHSPIHCRERHVFK